MTTTKEQAWTALRATMSLPQLLTWESAITQHTEREYNAVREQRRQAGRTSGVWRKYAVKRRAA